MIKDHLRDKEYYNIVKDIVDNKEFLKLSNIIHHECNRFDHSIRVSYWSYKVSKMIKLDYKKIARAALLHDFFLEETHYSDYKTRINTMLKHPTYALENAKKYYQLSELEEDIILTHMFPIVPRLPKYFESWMVDLVDDIVAVYEKTYVIRKQLSAAASFVMIFILNYIR